MPQAYSTLGVRDDLAVLVGEDLGQLVDVAFDEVAQGEHDARPAGNRGVPPPVERLAGRLDGRVDVGRGGQRDLGLLSAGGRVPDRAEAGGGPGRLRSGDPVLDSTHP
jgi:hypothetical protein